MHEDDSIKNALNLWQIKPTVDAALAVKTQERAAAAKKTAFVGRKEFQLAWACAAALVVVAGLAGQTAGLHQTAADTEAIVSVYLAKINPM